MGKEKQTLQGIDSSPGSAGRDDSVRKEWLDEKQNPFYRRVFEEAQTGILILSHPEGCIEDANPFLLHLLGGNMDGLKGKTIAEAGLVMDEQSKNVIKSFARVMTSHQDALTLHTYKGAVITVECASRVFSVGSRRFIQCNFSDISSSREHEERLRLSTATVLMSMQEVVETLTRIIESRDAYTVGHQARVSDLSVAIAYELGVNENAINGLRISSLVHDIGKISIPPPLLTKSAPLSSVELEMLHNHVNTGYEFLKGLQFPWPVADILCQHHERLDGSGYPKGLKDGDIFLEARIIAVADTLEAMASNRPYREALGIDAALAFIEEEKERLYDPAVVDAAVRLFREKNYCFPDPPAA